jgi:hypothetical protein
MRAVRYDNLLLGLSRVWKMSRWNYFNSWFTKRRPQTSQSSLPSNIEVRWSKPQSRRTVYGWAYIGSALHLLSHVVFLCLATCSQARSGIYFATTLSTREMLYKAAVASNVSNKVCHGCLILRHGKFRIIPISMHMANPSTMWPRTRLSIALRWIWKWQKGNSVTREWSLCERAWRHHSTQSS